MDKNQMTANKIKAMRKDLTEKALYMIDGTDFGVLEDLFGDLETAEELNTFAEEFFSLFPEDN
jgi:hypothetical protein